MIKMGNNFAQILLNGWEGSMSSNSNYKLVGKPKPYKWLVTSGGICEVYDFNYYKRSNPPPLDYETPVIPFFKGRYTSTGAWVTE